MLLTQTTVLLNANNETDSLRSVLMALPAGEKMEEAVGELTLRRYELIIAKYSIFFPNVIVHTKKRLYLLS